MRAWPTVHIVDPSSVLGPNWIVVVQSGLILHDQALVRAIVIRHKNGVARFPCVINEPGAIGRPGNLGSVLIQEVVRRSTDQRPQHESPGFCSGAPYLRSIGGESDRAYGGSRIFA